ncbi:hypothetical protein BKA61DRAFT_585716 [Leptodontidium sp. MPI-SDFR-AT-0119]|nr:hypothetical protein BKA61DRAFT_585716 [Leptodontidium sp. MPI-SDFR-AT-0119]
MRTTIVFTLVSTLLSFAAATPAGSLSEPNTNALLPLGARSALKGCFEQCGNNAQCSGACNHCSAGRVSTSSLSFICPSSMTLLPRPLQPCPLALCLFGFGLLTFAFW